MQSFVASVWRFAVRYQNKVFHSRHRRRQPATTCALFVQRLEQRELLSVPPQPQLNEANVTSPTSVELRWSDVSGEDRYIIYSKPDGASSNEWTEGGHLDRNDTSGTINGLTPGATYNFDMAAWNGSDHSPWSNVLTVTMPPATPILLTVTPRSPTSVDLVWTNVSGEDSYRLFYKLEGQSDNDYQRAASVGRDVTSGTISGLTAGVRYTFDVGAYKGDLHWNWSNAITVALPAAALVKPNLTRATAKSPTSVELVWNDISGEDRYVLYYKPNGASNSEWKAGPSVDANDTSGTIDGLTPGKSYNFDIAAFKGAYRSEFSNSRTVTLPLDTPSNLITSVTGVTKAKLTWQDNSNNETGFQIERKTGATGGWSRITTVGAGISNYENTNLTAGTTYFYRIRAVNSVANSMYSNEASATPATNGDSFEDDNTPTNAKTIAINGSAQMHSLNVNDDVDWVIFTLTQTSNVTIETSGTTGDTRMWVYGPNSSTTQIGFDDNSGIRSFSKIVSSGLNALGSGTYFVKVDENGNNATVAGYSLSVVAANFQVQSLAIATDSGAIHDWIPFHDGAVVGAVTSNGTETDDAYSFISGLNGSTTIRVASKGARPTLDPIVIVRDMTGAIVARFDSQRGARDEVGEVLTEAGRRYEINVLGYRATRGEYQLTIQQHSTFNPADLILDDISNVVHGLDTGGEIIRADLRIELVQTALQYGWSDSKTDSALAELLRVNDALKGLGNIGKALFAFDLGVAIGRISSVGGGHQIEAWNRLFYLGLNFAAGKVGPVVGGLIGTSITPLVGSAVGTLIGALTVPYLVTNSYDAFARDLWIGFGVEVFGDGV